MYNNFDKSPLLFRIPQKGKLAPERAEAYFKYALALLYEVPVPADDPLDDLPKEIDYLNLFDKDGITSAVKQDDGWHLLLIHPLNIFFPYDQLAHASTCR